HLPLAAAAVGTGGGRAAAGSGRARALAARAQGASGRRAHGGAGRRLPARADAAEGAVNALACTGLQVVLGERPVLHGIDVVLPAGRWTAVAGPNGAGQ